MENDRQLVFPPKKEITPQPSIKPFFWDQSDQNVQYLSAAQEVGGDLIGEDGLMLMAGAE